MSGDDVRNLVTIITAVISFLVAILTAVLSYVFNRKSQHDLEKLRADLEEKRRERDALRDYEYEARKRLYHECGPLLLQLMELSESALRRIQGLARTARQGNLGPARPSWLADARGPYPQPYYFQSTVYWLLAPLAIVKLLQRRLTLLDFSLDQRIFTQYSLAREMYDTFSADFRLAVREPVLPYDPESEIAPRKREQEPQVYRKQGIHRGLVDIVAEALITDVGQVGRIKSFGEFEQEYQVEGSPVNKAFTRVEYLLLSFHPKTQPVFWRLLITHAHLYRALLQTHVRSSGQVPAAGVPTLAIPAAERRAYDWRPPDEQVSDKVVLQDPFDVAEGYLRERLQHLSGESMPVELA
jgi:hypothetical protein